MQDRHGCRPQRRSDRENQPGIDAAITEALERRYGCQQVLTAPAVFNRHGQALHSELGAALVAFSPELAFLFSLDRNRVGKFFARTSQRLRTRNAVIPSLRNP